MFIVWSIVAWCAPVLALDPSLDVSQYAHTSWKIREGFSKGPIRSIAQTADGYLWLATEFGLLRFDGVRATPWQPSLPQRLPSNDIYRLLAAHDGALWIGTAKGLARWKNGTLTQYPQLTGRFVARLLEDHEGTVWASGTAVPTGKLCSIRGTEVTCSGDDGSLGFGVVGLYEDRKRSLWVGSGGGLRRWRPAPPESIPVSGNLDAIQGFAEYNGHLLITTSDGLREFLDGRLNPYPLSGIGNLTIASPLLADRDGGLWSASRSGGLVHILGNKADVFSRADGLSGDDVEVLFEDREGNVWVATTEGLDRFRGYAVSPLSSKLGVPDTNVRAVRASADGTVWFTTTEGVERWNNGQLTAYRTRHRSGTPTDVQEILPSGLPEKGGGALFVDRDRAWLATTSGSIGYLEHDRFVATGVSAKGVRSMVQDGGGNLWISDQYAGLLRLSPGGNVEQTPWPALGHQDFATALAVDKVRGGLWLGFWSGGIAYYKDGKIREAFVAGDGLGAGRITSFRFAPDGSMWVGSEGGLSTLRNGRLSTLTSLHGLPCDGVHWSIDDDAGSVWLNTACGLVRVARVDLDAWATGEKQSIAPVIFDGSDGVGSQTIPSGYEPYVTKDHDGRLWFAHQGVMVVDPNHLPFNNLAPPVHIERVVANRTTYDTSADESTMQLPALTRDLQIEYTALSLVAPEKMRFRYKLEGHDAEWQDVGTRRQAFYNDLPPRRYRFRVIASNNSGVWNETGATLTFSIAPAYYQTAWFRVAVAATILLLLAALYRLRVNYLAHRFNVRMEERVNERTRIARELHDTMLQSFQGALLKFHAVTLQIADRPDAKQALETVIEQATQAITEGRNAVQGLRSSTLAGNDLGRTISTLAEELARDQSGAVPPVCTVQIEGTPRDLAPLVHDDVYRIAAEALRNAFRHAHAQRIEVDIRYGQRVFRLRVRDDGQGIDPAVLTDRGREGHYGLAGMHERASLVKGKLTVWSEHHSGSEIELIVPASAAYPKE